MAATICTIIWLCLTRAQDEGLDIISEGLNALKNIARDMNEVCYYAYNSSLVMVLVATGD